MANIKQLDASVCGQHLIADCYLDAATLALFKMDESAIEQLLRAAAQAAGATVLSAHFHRFGKQAGITGVLVLAESHITIHTWPEQHYAAFDLFMCGDCNPQTALNTIIQRLNLKTSQVKQQTITRQFLREQE